MQKLINNNGEYAVDNMAEEFRVTERTIRYDLEKINSFFIKLDYHFTIGKSTKLKHIILI